MSERKLFGTNGIRGLTTALLLDIMVQTGKKQFNDNNALLTRPSGTEPVFRLYAEAKNQEKALKLVKDYSLMFQKILKPL